jgi:hypothetical protein
LAAAAELRAMARAFRETADALYLHFRLETEDHVAFARWANWDSPERRWYRYAATALPLLIFVVAVATRPGGELFSPGNGLFLAISVAASALTPLWMRHRLGQRVRRHLKANPDAGLTGAFTIEIHPEALAVVGPKGRSELARGQYFRPREAPGHWFLFVQDKAAFLLPKAPFTDEERDDIRVALGHFAGASGEGDPPA